MADVKQLVKRTGLLLDRVIPPPAGITILIYHRVGGNSGSEVDLDASMFERQLEHLAEHHRVPVARRCRRRTELTRRVGRQRRRRPAPSATAPTRAAAW